MEDQEKSTVSFYLDDSEIELPPIEYKNHYYWSFRWKTKEGYGLAKCMKEFGTIIVTTENVEVKVGDILLRTVTMISKYIYLDDSKSLSNSWCLWSKQQDGTPNLMVPFIKKEPYYAILLPGDM